MLIVLASVAGVGIGDPFVGALVPGVMLTAIYALYILYVGWRHPERVPALPPEDRELSGADLWRQAAVADLPPLLLIFAVLGSISFGIVFPTEAGAVGAVVARSRPRRCARSTSTAARCRSGACSWRAWCWSCCSHRR